MSNISTSGVKLAFLTALVSGFFVFINKFGVSLWNDAYTYTAAKNILAALLLTGLILLIGKYQDIKKLTKKDWLKLSLIGLIGGSVPFLMFFKSLTLIPASQAAFIHKTLFLWVALLAVPFLKEKLNKWQIVALPILFIGVFLFSAPQEFVFSAGSLLALGATVLWAIENVIAKKVLKDLSAAVVGWARMFIGSVFIILFLAFTNNLAGVVPSSMSQVGWVLLIGLALFTYVITWYSALQKAPATVVSSILVIAAPLTAILNSIFVTHTFPTKAIVPIILMLIGGLLISKQFDSFPAKFKFSRAPERQ